MPIGSPPRAEDFWGEDSASIQDALQAPVPGREAAGSARAGERVAGSGRAGERVAGEQSDRSPAPAPVGAQRFQTTPSGQVVLPASGRAVPGVQIPASRAMAPCVQASAARRLARWVQASAARWVRAPAVRELARRVQAPVWCHQARRWPVVRGPRCVCGRGGVRAAGDQHARCHWSAAPQSGALGPAREYTGGLGGSGSPRRGATDAEPDRQTDSSEGRARLERPDGRPDGSPAESRRAARPGRQREPGRPSVRPPIGPARLARRRSAVTPLRPPLRRAAIRQAREARSIPLRRRGAQARALRAPRERPVAGGAWGAPRGRRTKAARGAGPAAGAAAAPGAEAAEAEARRRGRSDPEPRLVRGACDDLYVE